MKIRDIFLKDPCRHFERVIKVNEIEPKILGQELEEYVVTPEIRRYFEDILDEFVESRRGQPEWVCAWISGYFGSGKSHFLKALAAIMGNLPIQLPGRREQINALDYFPNKWQLRYAELLKKEFAVKPVVINLLYPKTQESPPLSHIIFKEFMKQQGFADEPWVAEVERQLKLDGLLEEFEEKVEEIEGKPWKKLRETPLYTRTVMAKVLPLVKKNTFPDETYALKALEDQEKRLQITPEWLANRLYEEAQMIDPIKGRIVLLLDEVGLYIGNSHDRLVELQAIAETISQDHIRGKVWLIVTAQEALEEKIPEVARKDTEFQKLRDRFGMKFTLTPENITTVVQKRMLEKNTHAVEELRKQFKDHAGAIATGALLKGVARDAALYMDLPQESDFVNYYPFLMYHLFLIQRVLEVLRGKGYGAEGLTGRERSVLGIVQGVICQGDIPLQDRELGNLATFDIVFDAMEQEVQALRGTEVAVIKNLKQLDQKEKKPVQKVAKALFLLQQVGEWLPTTAENVAAVLYDRIGEDIHEKLKEVESCLKILVKEHYVAEKEGKYKFLHEVERSFERDMERQLQRIPTVRKQELAKEVLKEKLRDFQKVKYKGVKDFEIRIEIEDEPVFQKGHITLKVTSPLNDLRDEIDQFEEETARKENLIYLVTGYDPIFTEKIERVLALEKTLDEWKKRSLPDDERKMLREKETEMEKIRHEELPYELTEILRKATIIFKGRSIQLDGRSWKDTLNEVIEQCIADTFHAFEKGAVKVKEQEITKIISWTGGTLPQCYRELKIIDDLGNIREDAPLLSELLVKIRSLTEQHEARTGRVIQEYFAAPPYGWDPRVVRLGLAALLKRGSILVKSEDRIYTADEPGVADIFKSTKRFDNASFDLGVTLSREEEETASKLLAEIFGEHGKETPAEIWQTLQEKLKGLQTNTERLLQRLKDLGVGGKEPLWRLCEIARKILGKSTSELAIKDFISKQTVQIFRENMKAYHAVIELDENRKLEQAGEIKKFADITGNQELKRLISSDEFPVKWAIIFEKYKKAEENYRREYSQLHERVREKQNEALKSIQGHDAFKRKKEEAEKILGKISPPFQCDATPVVLNENWVCSGCQIALSMLKEMYQRIESWKQQILEELAFVMIEKPGTMEEECEIGSTREFDSFEAKIRAFAKRVLKRGKKIKVFIKMEEK